MKFFDIYNLIYAQMEGRSKPRKLDNFDAVSRGILRTGPWNLAKFFVENCQPY